MHSGPGGHDDGEEFNPYPKRVATSLDDDSPQRVRVLEDIENHLIGTVGLVGRVIAYFVLR